MSLKFKIFMPIIGILLISFVLLTFYLINDQRTKGENKLEEKAEIMGKLVASSVSLGVWRYDKNYTVSTIKSYFIDKEIVSIELKEKKGQMDFKFETDLSKRNYVTERADIIRDGKNLGYIEIGLTNYYLEKNLQDIRNSIIILTAVLVIILSIIIFIISHRITSPINKLRNITEKYSAGNLEIQSEITSKDEIGSLSHAFNKMANDLKKSFNKIQNYSEHLEDMVKQRTVELHKSNEELKIKNKIMLEDLHMAQKVQLGLIPDERVLPKLKKLKFGTKYLAMESIGGDLYDVINLGNDKYAVFIADVSGHGVPAALISTMVKVAFNSYAVTGADPAEVCNNVNERMCQFLENLEYDLTAFYGVIDIKNKYIQFTNAGHHPAYIYRKATKDLLVLQELNGYIGLMQDINFTSNIKTIHDGDKIILFTDGIVEAENEKGEIYDMERFENYIREFGHLPAEMFVSGLIEDVDKFCGNNPKQDDIAILCMDYYYSD